MADFAAKFVKKQAVENVSATIRDIRKKERKKERKERKSLYP